MKPLAHWFCKLPLHQWASSYSGTLFKNDLLAALIVTFLLIPQSLAYAQLAGLPAQTGLYASIVPLFIYALLGSCRVLSVGPVAVISLMTASTINQTAQQTGADPLSLAITLAFISGLILWVMGLLKLGFLANFLSHSVISGFINASAILIALSQLKVLLNIPLSGDTLLQLTTGLLQHISLSDPASLLLAGISLILLWLSRSKLKNWLTKWGLNSKKSELVAKMSPALLIALALTCSWYFNWQQLGIKIVGNIPTSLPPFSLPIFELSVWKSLLLPALLISIVGFVESVSVGQTLAAKRRLRIEPNQELIALGGCNLGSALSGGFPVTGGFSRSVVNFDAGAETPVASLLAAIFILLVSLLLTPFLYHLPQVVLAATIVLAVLSLFDRHIFRKTWSYARSDFWVLCTTLVATLMLGIETGLVIGVLLSLALFLYHTSRPHIAEVGLVAGSEHFRNTQRHCVLTSPQLLSIRIDESLYFGNARAIEDYINQSVARHSNIQHLVLLCSAINDIDASALASLETINHRLGDAGIQLHLSEVKGPVMDKLQRSQFLQQLTGEVFLNHYQAIKQLSPEVITAHQ